MNYTYRWFAEYQRMPPPSNGALSYSDFTGRVFIVEGDNLPEKEGYRYHGYTVTSFDSPEEAVQDFIERAALPFDMKVEFHRLFDPYPIDPDVTIARMKRKQASRLTYDPELYSNTGKDNLMWAWRPQAANWWVEFTGVPSFEREQAVIAHVRQLIAEGAGFDNMDAIERLVFEQEFGVKLHKWEGHFYANSDY